MSFKVGIVVLGLFGCYLAVPVDQPAYDPSNFYPSNRILGGTEAPDRAAPYMVALTVGYDFKILVCGASLVKPDKVLTAAHCIDAMKDWTGKLLSSALAVYGTNNWSDDRRTAQFSGYKNHPEYNPWLILNDVGVLTLKLKVVLDKHVKLITLNFKWLGGGEKAVVTGWGTTSLWGSIPQQLQLLRVTVMSPKECEDSMREAQSDNGFMPPVHPEIEICTMHEKGAGHGMCHGDSGSALVLEEDGRTGKEYQQVGVVSWGVPCALGYGDVFARISGLKEFILKYIESLPSTPSEEVDFFVHADHNARIVGGTQAPDGSVPYMAALSNGLLIRSFLCGGSVIATRTVLTAAHCIDAVFSFGSLSNSLRVTVGTNRWNQGGQSYNLARNVTHQHYVSGTIKNDIGVLITSSNIVSSATVAFVPLSFNEAAAGTVARVAGWGRIRQGGALSTVLLELTLATIDGQRCVEDVARAAVEFNTRAPPVEPHIEICTFHSAGHGTCNGDSGSALVRVDNGQQIGIVSWGFPCARGAPDMFVRVSAYRDWLLTHVV